MIEISPIWLSLRLSLVTTVILLFIAVPLSYWIAYSRSRWNIVLEALVSLPLVLPPTVLGFYLLLAFSPSGWFGRWLDHLLGIRLVFSFTGLVVASLLYSLPFMVNPLLTGFRGLSPSLKEASYTLGKSRLTTLLKVLLPNIRPAILTAIVMTFAHTLGEFGVVLMIGGNIPGQTRVASLAVYDQVQSMNYTTANAYAIILLLLSFILLLTVFLVNRHLKPSGPLP